MNEYDRLKSQKDAILSQEERTYYNDIEMRLKSGPHILTDDDIAAMMAAIKALHQEKRRRASTVTDKQ